MFSRKKKNAEEREGKKRAGNFLTPPPEGWLHADFALTYGNGVYYRSTLVVAAEIETNTPHSYPVIYCGHIPLKNSLRLVDFNLRQEITRECIARLREANKSKTLTTRKIPKVLRAFLEGSKPVIVNQEVDLAVSIDACVITTVNNDAILSNHPMSSISYANGGDFEV